MNLYMLLNKYPQRQFPPFHIYEPILNVVSEMLKDTCCEYLQQKSVH